MSRDDLRRETERVKKRYARTFEELRRLAIEAGLLCEDGERDG